MDGDTVARVIIAALAAVIMYSIWREACPHEAHGLEARCRQRAKSLQAWLTELWK